MYLYVQRVKGWFISRFGCASSTHISYTKFQLQQYLVWYSYHPRRRWQYHGCLHPEKEMGRHSKCCQPTSVVFVLDFFSLPWFIFNKSLLKCFFPQNLHSLKLIPTAVFVSTWMSTVNPLFLWKSGFYFQMKSFLLCSGPGESRMLTKYLKVDICNVLDFEGSTSFELASSHGSVKLG